MKKEKMNDKGFSLVELIIVIAIMAVLVVVLAPQYLKYVEKSRNSTDTSNATAIVTALQVYAADPDANPAFKVGDTFTITVNAAAPATVPDDDTAAGKALKEAAIDTTSLSCKSKTKWETYTIKGTVQNDGSIKFEYTSTGGTANAFADAMTGKASSTPTTSSTT